MGTCDIKGLCIHSKQDDFAAAKLTNEQVDATISINPQCKNHAMTEGTSKVLHLKMSKALHGTVRVTILWHALLTETLAYLGFKLNPHEFYVASATIKEK